jgi:hypothetical protein
MKHKTLKITADVSVSYIGPALDLGPMPSVFYFALSAEETLDLDPYNQPAVFLSHYPMRIFSMTLPGHGPGLPAQEALAVWEREIHRSNDIVTKFIDQVEIAIHDLKRKDLLIPGKIGVAGLSRGAFIAAHAAARISDINPILGFAPLTKLTYAREFHDLQHPSSLSLNLEHLIPQLIGRTLRFYIGNHDTRVGTEHCFDFIHNLANASFHKKIRSPKVELMIGPSIGHQGHGTAKEVFHNGAEWMASQLGVKNG